MGWRRVEGSDWPAQRGVQVDVVDDLVQVVKPVVGVLVLEVGAARPHLVDGLCNVLLLDCRLRRYEESSECETTRQHKVVEVAYYRPPR